MTTFASSALDTTCINTIRLLAIDAIEQAQSGHPGLPMGAAPMAYVLWQYHLQHAPQYPQWANRDRFVLSAGHGSMLLYALLHLAGYKLALEQLQIFRSLHSQTPGHPEWRCTPGVEATTGPLGQGAANAVGMAIEERYLAGMFNKPGYTLIDYHTYALVSDGDMMEGISSEAASLAGHLQLGKLIYLYDANGISLDGPTTLCFTEDVAMRYRAYGFQVIDVSRGDDDLLAINQAIAAAKANTAQPSLIIVHTTIGYGAPNKQNSYKAHGSPLGPDETKCVKAAFGFDEDATFVVPDIVYAHMQQHAVYDTRYCHWQDLFAAYSKAHPDLAYRFEHMHATPDISHPMFQQDSHIATREASHACLNAIAPHCAALLGGDADLSVSTCTALSHAPTGGNIHFGVREHAMGAIANGMAYGGMLRPYVATFLVFSDYMRAAMRLAALGKLPVIYILTHDSIAVGEDGPTHQPVEHLMSLRAIPNLIVIRPADAHETVAAWHVILTAQQPVALILSRQKLPVLHTQADVSRGAYIAAEAFNNQPQGLLIATGSELYLALESQAKLQQQGLYVRVVSMPSFELFVAQDKAYQESVLPKHIKARVSIEAGITWGWEKFIGDHGIALGIDTFGASAPGHVLLHYFQLTSTHIVSCMKQLLGYT